MSARMGAGHNGAANEIIAQMESKGWETKLVDFLDASPSAGKFLEKTYHFQIESAPWSYDLVYWLWSRIKILAPIATFFLSLFFSRRLTRWANEFEADLVISTYPFASVVLGRARARRVKTLRIPVVTYLTDFAVHPLWVHKGIDAHLCVSDISSHQVEQLLGRPAEVVGPVVPDRFRKAEDPDPIRISLGLPTDRLIVLVVAGSWGVGSLEQTVDELAEIDGVHPVVVCGRNIELANRLRELAKSTVFGWTDKMPELMAASDVVIQNAGGLSAMEAFRSGVPVVSYRPIAGHGRSNTIQMEKAGVTIWAKSQDELSHAIKSAAAGHELLTRRASALFSGQLIPVVEGVIHKAAGQRYTLLRRSDLVTLPRRLASLTAAVVTAFFAFNIAANAISSDGLNVAKTSQAAPYAYVVVKPAVSNINSTVIRNYMVGNDLSAVISGQLAQGDPNAIVEMSRAGIPILNGGWDNNSALHLFIPNNAVATSDVLLSRLTGYPVETYVPQEQVNSLDLAWISLHHQTLVHALMVGKLSSSLKIKTGAVYEVNGAGLTPSELLATLKTLMRLFRTQGIIQAPTATLGA